MQSLQSLRCLRCDLNGLKSRLRPVFFRSFTTNLKLRPCEYRGNDVLIKGRKRRYSSHNSALAHSAHELLNLSELRRLMQLKEQLLQSNNVPSEDACLSLLQSLERLAVGIAGRDPIQTKRDTNESSAVSALLSSDGWDAGPPRLSSNGQHLTEPISQMANDLLLHANVFITPNMLQTYTNIQALLGRPDMLPEIFDLYASKPIPLHNTVPVKFRKPNRKSVKMAIPGPIAEKGLQAAITVKNLPLALSIIDTTYGTPAFRRSKLLRKGMLPVAAAVLSPVACYALATEAAHFQTALDNQTATNLAFAGILAYVAFTSAIGYVALTTSNDQMLRVTWADGTPLRERWIREEERAAFDKVAIAWGFKEQHRWGEEEGQEWDELREYIRSKCMILDRTSLMEGME